MRQVTLRSPAGSERFAQKRTTLSACLAIPNRTTLEDLDDSDDDSDGTMPVNGSLYFFCTSTISYFYLYVTTLHSS